METVTNENNKYELYVNDRRYYPSKEIIIKSGGDLLYLKDECSVIKKLNSIIKNTIFKYTILSVRQNDITVELLIHIEEKCLELFFSTIIFNSLKKRIRILKFIVVNVKNDDDFGDLKKIAEDLSNEENDNSLIKNLNNLFTTNTELTDYNMQISSKGVINNANSNLIKYANYTISTN